MSHDDLVIQSFSETQDTVATRSDARVANDTAEFSRAQLVSSDINRAPRRPSMNVEPDQPNSSNGHARGGLIVPPRNEESRKISVEHVPRRENGHALRDNQPYRDANVYDTRESQITQTQPYGSLRDLSRDVSRRRGFQGVLSARTRGSNVNDPQDKDDRYVVPALPMPVAILCCILNFIVPGLGSMAASVCVFCCAKTEDMTCREKCGSCCTVFGIGVLQLLLVACFLIGWIWSCIWGVTFIGMSASYYNADDLDDGEDDGYYRTNTNNPVYQRSRRGRSPLPTPQVVVDQPYPGIHYDDVQRERERRRRREAQRRTRSRISLTPSNLIYPMRAPSNITYNSPPPPYRVNVTPTPDDPYTRQQRQTSVAIQEEAILR